MNGWLDLSSIELLVVDVVWKLSIFGEKVLICCCVSRICRLMNGLLVIFWENWV